MSRFKLLLSTLRTLMWNFGVVTVGVCLHSRNQPWRAISRNFYGGKTSPCLWVCTLCGPLKFLGGASGWLGADWVYSKWDVTSTESTFLKPSRRRVIVEVVMLLVRCLSDVKTTQWLHDDRDCCRMITSPPESVGSYQGPTQQWRHNSREERVRGCSCKVPAP